MFNNEYDLFENASIQKKLGLLLSEIAKQQKINDFKLFYDVDDETKKLYFIKIENIEYEYFYKFINSLRAKYHLNDILDFKQVRLFNKEQFIFKFYLNSDDIAKADFFITRIKSIPNFQEFKYNSSNSVNEVNETDSGDIASVETPLGFERRNSKDLKQSKTFKDFYLEECNKYALQEKIQNAYYRDDYDRKIANISTELIVIEQQLNDFGLTLDKSKFNKVYNAILDLRNSLPKDEISGNYNNLIDFSKVLKFINDLSYNLNIKYPSYKILIKVDTKFSDKTYIGFFIKSDNFDYSNDDNVDKVVKNELNRNFDNIIQNKKIDIHYHFSQLNYIEFDFYVTTKQNLNKNNIKSQINSSVKQKNIIFKD